MGRDRNTTVSGHLFDDKTIETVWKKAKVDAGNWAFEKDVCGASILRSDYGSSPATDGK